MGNKKRRNPPPTFKAGQQGPFQVVELTEGHRFTKPVWRVYMIAVQSNDPHALTTARVLTRVPAMENAGGHVVTMEQFAVLQQYTLLETATAMCDLEDEGLLVWDAERQIGRIP